MVEIPIAQLPAPVPAQVPAPANIPLERIMASLSGQHDPRLQDVEVTNLHNNMSNQKELSPNQPEPPPASPSYTGIDEEEDQ